MVLALDGAGAPLVTQCLGAMPPVVMLSRVHPAAENRPNAIEQADSWFGLFDDTDIQRLKSEPDWDYPEIIKMISDRAKNKDKTLILCDRSNDDFMAKKTSSKLPGLFVHKGALESHFTLNAVALVRHPIDQWIALKNQLGSEAPSPELFMRCYRRYCQAIEDIEVVKFEDFLADPGSVLTQICIHLDVPYDADWEKHWRGYSFVLSEPSREITEENRETKFNDEILWIFQAQSDYASTVEKLGYGNAT
jgi:hypothetical protein